MSGLPTCCSDMLGLPTCCVFHSPRHSFTFWLLKDVSHGSC
jgi:hypothetical protein